MGNFKTNSKALNSDTTIVKSIAGTETTASIAAQMFTPEVTEVVEPIVSLDDEEAELLAEEAALEKELRMVALRKKIADRKLAKTQAQSELEGVISSTAEAELKLEAQKSKSTAELAAMSVTLQTQSELSADDMALIQQKANELKTDRMKAFMAYVDTTIDGERAELQGRATGADNSLFTIQSRIPKSLRAAAEVEPEMKSASATTIEVVAA